MAKVKKPEEVTNEKLQELEAKFGVGTIMLASDKTTVKEWIPSGSITLDLATGGGIPRGKAVSILGKESSSKTTLSYHIIAEFQKKYPELPACFEDIEDSWDSDYAFSCGIDLSRLHLVNGEKLLKNLGVKNRTKVSAEEWLELTSKLIEMDIYSILCLDSIAALQPLSEIENGLQGGRLGSIASVMTRSYRDISSAMRNSDTTFLYTNQYRMSPGSYNPLTEPGGEAWRYLQSLKLEISKSLDKDEDGVSGIIVKGKVSKSKVCPPWKTFEYLITFGEGIVPRYEIQNLAVENEIILKTGNTYSYNGTKLGVGEKQLENFLIDNPELLEEIKNKVLSKLSSPKEVETTVTANLPELLNKASGYLENK